MGQGNQQQHHLPRLFIRKPKKSHGPPGAAAPQPPPSSVSAPSSAPPASFPKPAPSLGHADKARNEGLRDVSAALGASSSSSKPYWYRLPRSIATLLVVSVAVFGCSLLNNRKNSEATVEAEHDSRTAIQTEVNKHVAPTTGADNRTPISETDAGRIFPDRSTQKEPAVVLPKKSLEQQ